jgi:hypothetical protein
MGTHCAGTTNGVEGRVCDFDITAHGMPEDYLLIVRWQVRPYGIVVGSWDTQQYVNVDSNRVVWA